MVRGVGEKAEKTEGRGGARRIFNEDNHGAFILDIGIHIGIQFGSFWHSTSGGYRTIGDQALRIMEC